MCVNLNAPECVLILTHLNVCDVVNSPECVLNLTHLNVCDVIEEVDLRVNFVRQQKEITEELASRERTNQMGENSDELMSRHLVTVHGNHSDDRTNTGSTFMYEVKQRWDI